MDDAVNDASGACGNWAAGSDKYHFARPRDAAAFTELLATNGPCIAVPRPDPAERQWIRM